MDRGTSRGLVVRLVTHLMVDRGAVLDWQTEVVWYLWPSEKCRDRGNLRI